MKKFLSCACAFALVASCFGFVPTAWASQSSDYADGLDAEVAGDETAAGPVDPALPDSSTGGTTDSDNEDKNESGSDSTPDDTIDVAPPATSSPATDSALPQDDVLAPQEELHMTSRAANGWTREGNSVFYYVNGAKQTGWIVTSVDPSGATGALERYWLNPSNGALTKGFIDAGGGHYAFGKSSGAVVRGAYRDPGSGYWYFADNDGRLLSPGWHVTSAFGQGLQRYYIDAKAHAAVPGTSNDGWRHYTRGDTGYVARGKVNTPDGSAYFADDDGRLLPKGWLVTNAYTPDLQRYYINDEGKAALGLVQTGANSYAYGLRNQCYVLRGVHRDAGSGYWYFADNDGRLLSPGWHVTSAFGQGLQRYYIDAKAHAAVPGTSNDGWRHYTRGDTGYVARGRLDFPDGRILVADNDGRVPNDGWLVTTALGNGLQRYYIKGDGATAVGFFRVDGKAYYGIPVVGYVLRGKRSISGNGHTQVFLADDDGVLADKEGWLVTGAYDGGALQRYRIDSSVAPGYYGAHVGRFTVDGNDYYGREGQGYVVRGLYRAPDGNVYFGDQDGVLGTVKVSSDPELNQILTNILAVHGTDLRTLFNYVASYRYISGSKFPSGEWSVPFAKEMYRNNGGNCYRYAALFCWLAKAVGYDANVVSGYVPSRSQGWAAHGWVEIHMNGTTYVCDPDLAHEIPGRNWYMTTYGNAPTTYRR